jgi:hypothetical protein
MTALITAAQAVVKAWEAEDSLEREDLSDVMWEAISRLRVAVEEAMDVMPKRYWHGYQAEVSELLEDSVGPAVGFTVVAESPVPGEEAPRVHLGTVLGRELVFRYACTWDHEPTEAEKEECQLAQFQLVKEKEGNDNAGSGS